MRIRRVDAATGVITTFAGGGAGGDGGPATEASLAYPSLIALAGDTLYFYESGAIRIREVTLSTGTISTFAQFDNAFHGIAYITADRSKHVYVSQFATIVRISKGGATKTIAGMEYPGTRGDGGPARRALVAPFGLAFDRRGNLFLANFNAYLPPFDDLSSEIRRIDARTRRITTVAGTTGGYFDYSGDGGPALEAGFTPTGIAFDGAGNLYIADSYNGRVRVVKGLGRR
jgi:DNA-binding beta-propeller fold protein YncE